MIEKSDSHFLSPADGVKTPFEQVWLYAFFEKLSVAFEVFSPNFDVVWILESRAVDVINAKG